MNILARTVYAEGRGEGQEGMEAVLQVICNRAGNKKDKFVSVVRKPSAFSCWNSMTKSDWDNFKYKVPSSTVENSSNMELWKSCVKMAKLAFEGKFECSNKELRNCNAYLNPDKANEVAKNTWGKKMTIKLGKHKFGYLREYDPSRKSGVVAKTNKAAPQKGAAQKSSVANVKRTPPPKGGRLDKMVAKSQPRGFLKDKYPIIREGDETSVSV